MIKKIVYLHGLESKAGGPKVDFLATKGLVYAPEMDFKTLDLYDLMGKIGKPDLIIGSSMGGYFAFAIATSTNHKCILLNPAVHSRTFEIDGLTSGKERIIGIVALGAADDIISPGKTFNMLRGDWNDLYMHLENNMGHRVPLSVFIDMYNKMHDEGYI